MTIINATWDANGSPLPAPSPSSEPRHETVAEQEARHKREHSALHEERWLDGPPETQGERGTPEPTMAEIMTEDYHAKVREVVTALASGKPLVCPHCKRPATCVGAYENPLNLDLGCDDCCGHGSEDGWCVRLAPPSQPEETRGPTNAKEIP